MFSKMNQTKGISNSKKRNSVTHNLVKLTILAAAVLLQVGFRPDVSLARTTYRYAPVNTIGSSDIIRGEMRWSFDATGTYSTKPIINVWNGGGVVDKIFKLIECWTVFYETHFDNIKSWMVDHNYCKRSLTCNVCNPNTTAVLDGIVLVDHQIKVYRFNKVKNPRTGLISDVPVTGVSTPANYALVTLKLELHRGEFQPIIEVGSQTVLMKYIGKY
jgi:hypothetical protein